MGASTAGMPALTDDNDDRAECRRVLGAIEAAARAVEGLLSAGTVPAAFLALALAKLTDATMAAEALAGREMDIRGLISRGRDLEREARTARRRHLRHAG
jgi:hypothetical protein